jgi:hypothetical protein
VELIVSLPRNEVELAVAAAKAGATYLKLHMNVEHRASGTRFGTFAEEADTVRAVMRAVDIPVGLMPGADISTLPTNDELGQLAADGLDFIDIYTQHMPLRFIELPLKLVAAFDSFDGFIEPLYYQTHYVWPPDSNRNRIWMAEASICKPEEYGTPFSFRDLRRLRIMQEYFDCPVLVPTQKAITPEDAVWLQRAGAGGLMIGAIVVGMTPESIAAATAGYRHALDHG